MTHETAKKQGLEPVYPEQHRWGERIFWDPKEGRYYDTSTDLYCPECFDPILENDK